MINTDDSHLLFIEPLATDPEPTVDDEFTALAQTLFDHADDGGDPSLFWCGVHRCACGARSDNKPWRISGVLTNSLMVHYVRDHRSEVPAAELEKLQRIAVMLVGKLSGPQEPKFRQEYLGEFVDCE